MQSISQLVTEQKQKLTGTQSQAHSTAQSTSSQSNHNIDQLFACLTGLYGLKWTSQYPSIGAIKIAQAEWLECIKNITPEQISAGLQKCRESDGKFPPSAPEFATMCRETKSFQDKTYAPYVALTCKKEQTPGVAEGAVEKIKELLRKR